MDNDKRIRIIILYDIGAEYTDEKGEAVSNMTHLSSELASQQIMVNCVDNVLELIEETDPDKQAELDSTPGKLVRIGDQFIMGLEIDPLIQELPTIYSILSDWDFEGELDSIEDVQYKIFCANFENTILNGFVFYDEYPPEKIPEHYHQPEDTEEDEDDLDDDFIED